MSSTFNWNQYPIKITFLCAVIFMLFEGGANLSPHLLKYCLFGYFIAPALWVCWIFSVLVERKSNPWLLTVVWVVVDVSILFLFMANAKFVEGWSHTRDVDMVVVAAYFPVIFPLLFVFSLFPAWGSDFLERVGLFIENQMGAPFAFWILLSVVAGIQSLVFFFIFRDTFGVRFPRR